LFIPYDRQGGFNSRGWLSILCPYHNDKNLGSCFVHTSTVVKCFSCGAVSNLFTVVKLKNPSFTNREVFKFLGTEELKKLDRVLSSRKSKSVEKEENNYSIDFSSLKTKPVDLGLYYCRSRKFTQEWIDKHKIKIVTDGYYKDYFAIPIMYQGKLLTYEFRKAYEYEYLREIYQTRGSLEDLRAKFKKESSSFGDESVFKYLRKPKVLYPKNISLDIIFDYDNLDRESDLYICEGVAGIPVVEKFNVTSTFGSNITYKQIDVLKEFKGKKILIHDGDEAGDKMLWELVKNVEEVYVFPGDLKGSDFLIDKSGVLDGIKIR